MNDIKRLSEIKIREDRKATLQFLVNRVKQRKEDFPAPPFFLLLGAGCSSDAQIPIGTGLVKYLQKRCYAENYLSIPDRSLLQLGKDKINTLNSHLQCISLFLPFCTFPELASADRNQQKSAAQ